MPPEAWTVTPGRHLRPGAPYPRGHALGRLVVDQDVAYAGGEGPFELRVVLDFDDDRQAGGSRPERAGEVPRPEQRPMVVLPEHGRGERAAILHSAAHRYRVGLERAQTRRGLARMRDVGARSRHGFHDAAREGRDPGEALQEVEGDPLAREQRGRARPGAREHGAGRYPVAFGAQRFDARSVLELRVHERDEREARDHEAALGHELGARRAARGRAE